MNKGWYVLHMTLAVGLVAMPLVHNVGQQGRPTRPISQQERRLPGSASSHEAHIREYGNLPLSFEANQGQTDDRVKFLSRGSGYTLFLTSEEAVLALHPLTEKGDRPAARKLGSARGDAKSDWQPSAVARMKLVGANRSAQVRGVEELPGKSNYFLGSDPTKWRTNVPTYARVEYVQVYPGVDLVYYGNPGQLEYDFVIAPNANPRAIRLAVDGARKIEINSNGDLVLHVRNRELLLHKPATYQEENGARKQVAAFWVLQGKHRVGLKVAMYDTRKPLIIDPVLSYATFLGGNGSDFASAIAVDGAGNAYVTGMTVSPDFPTVMPIQPAYAGGNDAFVAKLNAAGSGLVFSTFLGGTGLDVGNSIALDPTGNVYVTGQTSSPDFPLANAFQKTCANCPMSSHVFVAKLNPAGNAFVYSSYLGGSSGDASFGITADSSGNAYIAGDTTSTDFQITPGALQPACAGGASGICTDGFVAKVKADGSALVYSTYLGGTLDDHVAAIAIDSFGNAYVTGNTSSNNFPTTPGAFISKCDIATLCNAGFLNAFVTKLNAAGSALVYSTYLGGSFANDAGEGITVDAAGDAYVTGGTASFDFPTTSGVVQPRCTLTSDGLCDGNAFITKFKPDGSGLLYSTYLGGSFIDAGTSIAVDSSGDAYVVGSVTSGDFPTASPLQPCAATGITSSFVTKLNTTASSLVFSTCLGGLIGFDGFGGIALDSSGNAYLAGHGQNFPTTAGVFRSSGPGPLVVKIGPGDAPSVAFSSQNLVFTDQTVGTTSALQVITLFNMGSAPVTINSIVASGDFGQTNNCGSVVPGASSCTISVTFSPATTGTRSGTIAITYNAAGSPQDLSLTGTGILPAATLAPSSLTLGSQQIGTSSAAQNITLTNTGIGPLVLTTIVPVPPGDFQEADNCLGLVPQGASCTLSVRFTPTAGGTRTAMLTLTDNAQNTPQLVPLTGTGTGPGISLSTTNLVFPNQAPGTTSMAQSVTLTNNGTAALTISNIQVPPAYSQSNTCGTSVAAGLSCVLSITFSPPTAGNYQGAIAISDNVPTSPQSITLSGSSSGTPKASLSSNSLSFGTVLEGTSSATQSVTLSNTGNATLNISSIAVVGVDYSQTNNCGSSLSAGSNCTINVSYAPTSSGTNQTRIDISDDAAVSPQSIALSGTGTEFLLTPATGAPTSQTVSAGATANYSLTLTPSATTRDTVVLSCSGAPSAATCGPQPNQQTFTSTNPVAVTVSVSTTARAVLPLGPRMRPGLPNVKTWLRFRIVYYFALLAAAALLVRSVRRFREGTMPSAAARPAWTTAPLLALGLAVVIASCGGGGSSIPPPGSSGTPAGSYTIIVTAKSASSTNPDQSVTLTLHVN